MKRKIFAIFTLLLICVFSVDAYADTNIKKANNQLNDVKNSINNKKGKVKEIGEHQQQVKDELNTLEQNIRKTSGEISGINIKIDSVSSSMVKLAKDISLKKKNITKQQKLLDKRIGTLYKAGSFGYLTILFGAKDISDLLQKAIYLSKIVNIDKQLIRSLNSDKADLEKDKKQLAGRKKELFAMKSLANKKMDQLNSQSDEKQKLMDKLSKDKKEYVKQIEEDEQAAKELTGKIKSMKAMILAAKREAERKRAEAAKRAAEAKKTKQTKNNQSNGGDSDSSPNQSGNFYCVTGRPYSITSSYGYRIHPITNKRTFHAGIDIGVPMNTPIYALADGIVTYAAWMNGYGNVVMIAHGNIISVYGHNSSLSVSTGQHVKGGQLISHSGSTGNSTGPHLHFEIRDNNGNTINPVSYYVH
ncbi:murein hydrolase activator EnvC family protein [Clostridium oryzae]|uniref:Murein hydrolase activator EnvC n=1 Tax=Clostridium oryzae TaxID=1450648 RepID=A0A1V4J0C5_9CLOT|nr:peptidoglycan DD-metalloendopeptidase family protein [Clostridium oryzae]OPJ65107.1 murein hydrolase activator EnvC precursor [Clostridium oryzae]